MDRLDAFKDAQTDIMDNFIKIMISFFLYT